MSPQTGLSAKGCLGAARCSCILNLNDAFLHDNLGAGGAWLASGPAAANVPCDAWAKRLPGVTRALCEDADLRESGALSVRKCAILMRDIQTRPSQVEDGTVKQPLRMLVVGVIHGDEQSSAGLFAAMDAAGQAGRGRTGAARHMALYAALNPDGFFMQPPRRMNARGVDLNRNFSTPSWARYACTKAHAQGSDRCAEYSTAESRSWFYMDRSG
jgi:hypothetical protein